MSEITVEPKRRTGLLIWLIVSQLLVGASLMLWFVILILYGMADQGYGPSLGPIFSCYPIFPLAMCIGAWIAYMRRKNILATILSGLPLSLVPVMLFILNNPYAYPFWEYLKAK